MVLPGPKELTHFGLVTPYSDIDLGQHWQHQAITWTDFDLKSMGFHGTHLRPNSQKVLQISIRNSELKKNALAKKLLPYFTGANELKTETDKFVTSRLFG